MESKITNIDKISRLYNSQTYFDLYGGSTVFSILFVLAFFSLYSYIHLSKRFASIRKEWPKWRCNPQVMPIAGLINKTPHKSILESTADNFTNCTTTILTDITGEFLQPIYSVTSSLNNMVHEAVNDVQLIRNKIGDIGHNISNIDKEIMGRIMNFMMPVRLLLLKFKDMLGKTNATIVGGIYTAIGTYLGVKSFINAFAIILLIGLAFSLATGGALAAGIFTAPLAPPFFVIAAIITAGLIFVGLVELEVKRKT